MLYKCTYSVFTLYHKLMFGLEGGTPHFAYKHITWKFSLVCSNTQSFWGCPTSYLNLPQFFGKNIKKYPSSNVPVVLVLEYFCIFLVIDLL